MQGRLSFMVGGRPADADLMSAARARSQRRDQLRAARPQQEPRTIVLVACSKKKGGEDAPAQDLYTSPIFKKARAYAEGRGDSWFILSALHGLLEPQTVISPYNVTLRTYSKHEREQWASSKVLPRLKARAPEGSRIIILAGRTYFENIEPELLREGFAVEIPMRGMDIYQMLRFLKEQT